MRTETNGTEKVHSLTAVLLEMKDEVVELVQTRISMLKRELVDNLAALKVGGTLALLSLSALGAAFVILNLAAVAVLAVWFLPSPYHWFYGLAIVGGAWLAVGLLLAYFAMNEFRTKGVVPMKTIHVLKADRDWLQMEVEGRV